MSPKEKTEVTQRLGATAGFDYKENSKEALQAAQRMYVRVCVGA